MSSALPPTTPHRAWEVEGILCADGTYVFNPVCSACGSGGLLIEGDEAYRHRALHTAPCPHCGAMLAYPAWEAVRGLVPQPSGPRAWPAGSEATRRAGRNPNIHQRDMSWAEPEMGGMGD